MSVSNAYNSLRRFFLLVIIKVFFIQKLLENKSPILLRVPRVTQGRGATQEKRKKAKEKSKAKKCMNRKNAWSGGWKEQRKRTQERIIDFGVPT